MRRAFGREQLPMRAALLCLISLSTRVGWFMRFVAVLLVGLLFANSAAAEPSVEDVFRSFNLIGDWALDCKQSASPANPHVAISVMSPGLVLEEHTLGDEYAVNRYSVLSAARLSSERLSVEVVFAPGTENEQRQKLILQIRKGTRRTLFNQPEGGEVRVKNGIALSHRTRTPLLKKCGA
jgi:hypothetical protein